MTQHTNHTDNVVIFGTASPSYSCRGQRSAYLERYSAAPQVAWIRPANPTSRLARPDVPVSFPPSARPNPISGSTPRSTCSMSSRVSYRFVLPPSASGIVPSCWYIEDSSSVNARKLAISCRKAVGQESKARCLDTAWLRTGSIESHKRLIFADL